MRLQGLTPPTVKIDAMNPQVQPFYIYIYICIYIYIKIACVVEHGETDQQAWDLVGKMMRWLPCACMKYSGILPSCLQQFQCQDDTASRVRGLSDWGQLCVS